MSATHSPHHPRRRTAPPHAAYSAPPTPQVQHGVDESKPRASAQWGVELTRGLCERCAAKGLFGAIARRRVAILRVCERLLDRRLRGGLAATAVRLASAARNRSLTPDAADTPTRIEAACDASCPASGPSLARRRGTR